MALTENKLRVARQVRVPIRYRGRDVGEHRLDLLVENTIIIELKAVAELDAVFFATLRSYLKATGKELGLLMNFAAPTLTIKRVGREWHSRCAGSG